MWPGRSNLAVAQAPATLIQTFSGPGRRLRITPSDVETMRAGGSYALKYRVLEQDGGSFTLSSASWQLEDPAGAVIASGLGRVNNSDQWLGRTLQTVQVNVDLTAFSIVPIGVDVAMGGFPYKMLVNVDVRSLLPPGGMQPDWATRATAWSEYGYLVLTIRCADGGIDVHRIPVRMLGGNAP